MLLDTCGVRTYSKESQIKTGRRPDRDFARSSFFIWDTPVFIWDSRRHLGPARHPLQFFYLRLPGPGQFLFGTTSGQFLFGTPFAMPRAGTGKHAMCKRQILHMGHKKSCKGQILHMGQKKNM